MISKHLLKTRSALVFAMFLIFSCTTVNAEEWQIMFDNHIQKVSHDPSSVVKEPNGVVSAWLQYDYSDSIDGTGGIRQVLFKFEIDCPNKRLRTLTSKILRSNGQFENGKGSEWGPPGSDGPLEDIFLFFCPGRIPRHDSRTPEIKRYLTEKYSRIDIVNASFEETSFGPRGHIYFTGDIAIPNLASYEKSYIFDIRGIAKAFMKSEAKLLGIDDISEYRERAEKETSVEGVTTSLYFEKFIEDLRLDRSSIVITIRTSGSIWSVNAFVNPTPPELYEAVKKPTLPESKIREIIEKDLQSANKINIQDIEKVAISSLPYVVWKVTADKNQYTVDAFTGRIINKYTPPKKIN